MKFTITRRRSPRIYAAVVLTHADQDGSPVLIERSSWRTISGIMINTGRGYAIFEFRRHG